MMHGKNFRQITNEITDEMYVRTLISIKTDFLKLKIATLTNLKSNSGNFTIFRNLKEF